MLVEPEEIYGDGPSAFLEQYGKDQAALQAWKDAFQVAGLGSNYSSSSSYQGAAPTGRVSYAEAPQGRTSYAVSEVQVDAFGPQDSREIIAAIAGYSTQANNGANQLMDRAQSIAQIIAESVSENAESSLRVATIEAENRGSQQAAEAIIAAILAAKPTQQTNATATSRFEVPTLNIEAARVAPSVQTLVSQNCAKCHVGEEPKGGVTVHAWDINKAIEMVASGKMPPKSKLSPSERRSVIRELTDKGW